MMMTEDLEDEVEEEDQELGQAETYADYMPAKCMSFLVQYSFGCHVIKSCAKSVIFLILMI